jgi:hypothetical protein
VERRLLAHRINNRIRLAAEGLGRRALGGRPVQFFCECGCLERVEVPLSAFVAAGGAWLDGHTPTR